MSIRSTCPHCGVTTAHSATPVETVRRGLQAQLIVDRTCPSCLARYEVYFEYSKSKLTYTPKKQEMEEEPY